MERINLSKHGREFARALANNKYEVTDTGIAIASGRLFLNGTYVHTVNGMDERRDANLVPTEGMNYILDSFVSSHGAIPLYLSLYAGAISPAVGWTAASYPATASEITSGSEGYSESVRQTWTTVAAASAIKTNAASLASFTIITASALVVNGAALTTASAKGATTGAIISATRFSAARTFNNTDVFQLKYEIDATTS